MTILERQPNKEEVIHNLIDNINKELEEFTPQEVDIIIREVRLKQSNKLRNEIEKEIERIKIESNDLDRFKVLLENMLTVP